jgi:RNA polymerase subunit RPABC4/transcription elongation factor Spt4
MKYCYHCGKMTAGDPSFCGTCGRTYDVRLCPRLHANPRGAEVCSKCGSRELSTPQPKIPMALRLLALMARLGLGLILFYVTLILIVDAVRTPQVQQTFIAVGMLLSILWWMWSKLPDWLQEAIRSFWVRRHDDGD